MTAIAERERQRAACQQRLEALRRVTRPIDSRTLERKIRGRLRDCAEMLGRQVGSTRALLRELLAERIGFTPHTGPDRRWYEFAGRINPSGLLAGEVEVPQAMVTPGGYSEGWSASLAFKLDGLAFAA